MHSNDTSEMVEVFAGNTWQAEMVKSILADNDIDSYLRDEIIGTLSPWWAAPGGAGSVKIEVSRLDFDKAKAIVAEYEENISTNG